MLKGITTGGCVIGQDQLPWAPLFHYAKFVCYWLKASSSRHICLGEYYNDRMSFFPSFSTLSRYSFIWKENKYAIILTA